MTRRRDLKDRIRNRMAVTGEPYTKARAAILAMGSAAPAEPPRSEPLPVVAERVEAVVIAVNDRSARVRFVDGEAQVDFKTADTHRLVAGQLATLYIAKRWMARYENASGTVIDTRIDLDAWKLPPLAMEELGGETFSDDDAPDRDDPLFALWRRATRSPRLAFEMDAIAWDAIGADSDDPDDAPTCVAVDLQEAGDITGARRLYNEVLRRDLRCIDAHVGLGNLVFDRDPTRAKVHYEIACAIGERAIGPAFAGVLPWSLLFNRPYLRALFGLGLVQWREKDLRAARETFERVFWLNPVDEQNVGSMIAAIARGEPWGAGAMN